MWNSKIWLQPLILCSLKFSGFSHFRVFINILIANMYYEIRNRMAMKEKTDYSMKIFNFSCYIENKIVTFLQPIVKNFHLRCGLIGCMMSNQWWLSWFDLFLSWCNTSVLKKLVWDEKTLKFWLASDMVKLENFRIWSFQSVYQLFDCKHVLWNKK